MSDLGRPLPVEPPAAPTFPCSRCGDRAHVYGSALCQVCINDLLQSTPVEPPAADAALEAAEYLRWYLEPGPRLLTLEVGGTEKRARKALAALNTLLAERTALLEALADAPVTGHPDNETGGEA